ncbi:putative Ig domain-containing protein [Streptomyces xanthophaeus]|uniref:putative Ig domain-containing protein n=1 Tax=Streptomyces xanthophaeus TaxID=67385 RepID=UPI0038643F48|nr:putative Ig domain-containing protein [Streptomyces xanthophaeus]WST58425.1 putative Ig domain-containing protein [Streptomyces xanthophaeus]
MSRLLVSPRAAAAAASLALLCPLPQAAAAAASTPASTPVSVSVSVSVSGNAGQAAAPAAPERKCTLPAGLTEISGLAMSTRHPGVFYAVNDSGNTNQVFAVECSGPTGQLRATLTVTGTSNTDWEALSVGRDPAGRPVILVGDIGDNFSGRAELTVHSFPEPDTLANAAVTPVTHRLAYSDGRHDAESLLTDPVTGQWYVASKLIGATGQLYKAPLPPQTGQLNTLTPVRPGPVFATDGAFSPTGKSYTLRSGGPLGANTASVYDAPTGAKLADVALPAQPQGEIVTYADCATLLVGSENDNQIWRVPLPAEAAPGCDVTTPPPTGDLKLANPGPQTCKFNQSCTIQLTTTGGKPPVRHTASGLPWGLTLDAATGRITGRPWGSGTVQITATATDTTGASATAAFPLTLTWL